MIHARRVTFPNAGRRAGIVLRCSLESARHNFGFARHSFGYVCGREHAGVAVRRQ